MLIVAPPGTRIQFASCSTALWAHIQMKRGLKCGSVFFQVAWLANICFSSLIQTVKLDQFLMSR